MTKQQAIYASYMLCEALNDKAFWHGHMKRMFGTHGRLMASQAIAAMASEFNFEQPTIVDMSNGDPEDDYAEDE